MGLCERHIFTNSELGQSQDSKGPTLTQVSSPCCTHRVHGLSLQTEPDTAKVMPFSLPLLSKHPIHGLWAVFLCVSVSVEDGRSIGELQPQKHIGAWKALRTPS